MTCQPTAELISILSGSIDKSRIGRVLLVGDDVQPIANKLSELFSDHRVESVANPLSLLAQNNGIDTEQKVPQHCELLCFVDAFQSLTKVQKVQVLSRSRDLLARRILHLEPDQSGTGAWSLQDSLSLGFSRIDTIRLHQQLLSVYSYNIYDYKKTPEWLNSKHWSNPQNWDRFRW